LMIRRIQITGKTLRIAGSGESGVVDGVFIAASFSSPTCVALNPTNGDVLICDAGGSALRDVTTSGEVPPPPRHSFAMRVMPSLFSGPSGMVKTSDGSVWFAERTAGYIGRVFPNRSTREYVPPGNFTQTYDPALGPDSSVWFGNFTIGQFGNEAQAYIGRISSTGKIVEQMFPNECSGYPPSYPNYLAADPAGNVWFVGTCPASIGFDSQSHGITQFVAPQFSGLAIGPGPIVWAGNSSGLFAYSSAGTLLQSYNIAADAGVALGAGGDVWVLSNYTQSVSKLDPSNGSIVTFQLPGCNCSSRNLGNPTFGPDGALWFTEGGGSYNPYAGMVGRITTRGVLVEFPTYEPHSQPSGIAFDANGDLWVADFGANKIGRMR
jgi:streptogramin lyase